MIAVILSGGLLTTAYVFPVVSRAFASEVATHDTHHVPRVMEFAAIALALIAVALGLFAPQRLEAANPWSSAPHYTPSSFAEAAAPIAPT